MAITKYENEYRFIRSATYRNVHFDEHIDKFGRTFFTGAFGEATNKNAMKQWIDNFIETHKDNSIFHEQNNNNNNE